MPAEFSFLHPVFLASQTSESAFEAEINTLNDVALMILLVSTGASAPVASARTLSGAFPDRGVQNVS